jgi:nucleoside-diphosphate-sugar epimerase
MSWSASMGCILIAAIAAGAIGGWVAKWLSNAEVRAIKRARRLRREAWRHIRRTNSNFKNPEHNWWLR